MSDMTTEEILAKATPRPWRWEQATAGVDRWLVSDAREHSEHGAHAPVLASGYDLPQSEVDANWGLVVLAVNSYEKQRDCIRELLAEITEILAVRSVGQCRYQRVKEIMGRAEELLK